MNEENIAVRLKLLIENLGINSSQFADNCNISRPTLSLMLSGRNKKISDVIKGQIHRAYPGLSIMWLLFNEGDMWVGQPSGEDYCQDNTNNPSSQHSTGNDQDKSNFNHLENSTDNNAAKISGENPYEISEMLTGGEDSSNNPKENGLNQNKNSHEISAQKGLSACLKNPEFFSEIAKIRTKSRKVVQVTIYYDDSTFETFYPGR